MALSVVAVLFLLAIVSGCTNSQSSPEVAAPAGTFRGTVLTSLQGHPFKAFMGIPFALPPVGNLRFQKPQPYPKIDGTFDATALGPRCIQPEGVHLGDNEQEDCLYLNVYVPYTDNQDVLGQIHSKKTFVYIYGGGLFMGSANEFVPGDFVASADIVVVTMNYRVSWLGFLKGNTSELPGNLGFWDQLLALNWVKDNIKSFGGDPDDITIGGNSMGAWSVSILSISPYGKGLFTKGFMTSGNVFTTPSTFGSSDFLLDKLAGLVGCQQEDGDSTDDVVRCLRELPEEAFRLPVDMSVREPFMSIDGDLLPRAFSELINDADYLTDVGFFARKYIVSMTNNEGPILWHGPFLLHNVIGPDDVDAEFVSNFFQLPVPVCQKMLDWYSQPGHSFMKPGYDIFGDYIFLRPSDAFLETGASHYKGWPLENPSNVYFLFMNFTAPAIPPSYKGIFHAMDLVYLFDIEPREILSMYYERIHTEKDQGIQKEDLKIKNKYMALLADFIKTSVPGTSLAEEAGGQWPPFDLDSEVYLSMEPEPVLRQFPLKQRRQFWTQVLPSYLKEFQNSSA